MGYALPITVVMENIECGGCGLPYAVPQQWLAEKRNSGAGFRCPNGCPRVFRKTELDRVKEKLEEQTRVATELAERARVAERAEQQATEARLKTQRELDKLRKRTSAGVCPCCTRSFSNLARHMKTKHPEQVKAS